MKISNYLKTDRIILDIKAKNKQEAINKLAAVLKDDSQINNFDKFVDDIFERENLGTTGIGFNLALPHARTDFVNSFVIVIGRFSEPVDFNSLDAEPVNLIFLMGTPKQDVQNYLGILAHLTHILKKDTFRTQLLEAKSAQEMIDIFKIEEQ